MKSKRGSISTRRTRIPIPCWWRRSNPMAGRHLAQFNISRNRYPLTDPRMKDFLDNVERVHQAAERIDGFIWRLHDETGHAMNIRVYDDPEILPNLTVWRDVEALERFVWQTL